MYLYLRLMTSWWQTATMVQCNEKG